MLMAEGANAIHLHRKGYRRIVAGDDERPSPGQRTRGTPGARLCRRLDGAARGPQEVGTASDRPSMDFRGSGDRGRQDCVDEATNTTSYLLVLRPPWADPASRGGAALRQGCRRPLDPLGRADPRQGERRVVRRRILRRAQMGRIPRCSRRRVSMFPTAAPIPRRPRPRATPRPIPAPVFPARASQGRAFLGASGTASTPLDVRAAPAIAGAAWPLSIHQPTLPRHGRAKSRPSTSLSIERLV